MEEAKKNIIEEETTSGPSLVVVRDTYKVAYILHFFLGASNLLPWNAFITAIDYFSHLYPSKHVERVFSVAYMGSSLLVLLLLVATEASSSSRVSLRVRMNIGLAMFILCLMVSPIVDWTHLWAASPKVGFAVGVGSVVICGLADGLIGGSLIGSAGKLPKEFMQAVFAGTASSGVLVSILRIITKASLPDNPQGLQTSAHFYFIVSATILLVCIVCTNFLFTLPIMHHHDKVPNISLIRPKILNTAKKILFPTLGILSIYVVTLSIFPGFIDETQSSDLLKDWYPILLITVYNFSDLVGKSITSSLIPNNVGKVTWLCFGRVVFYPLFRECLHGKIGWMKSEVSMVLLTFLLGLSNGYLTSVLMILAPKSVSVVEAEVAAIVMAVSLGFGLLGGSVLGWLWIL